MSQEEVTTDIGEETVCVGRTFHYFSQLSVAGVWIESGCKVRKGDRLRFGQDSNKPHEEAVFSMELNHQQISKATGPIRVGIEVSRRVEAGTPVYLLRRES